MNEKEFCEFIKRARKAGNINDIDGLNDILNQLNLYEELTDEQRKVISDLELSFQNDNWTRFRQIEDTDFDDILTVYSKRETREEEKPYVKMDDEESFSFRSKPREEEILIPPQPKPITQRIQKPLAERAEDIKAAKEYFKQASATPESEKEEIIRLCTKAIELYPDYDEAYFLRGNCNEEICEYQNAIDDYTLVIRLVKAKDVPNKEKVLSKVYKKMAKLFIEIGEFDNAIKSFTSVLKQKPKSASSYINRGLIYNQLEDYENAIKDFSSAIEIVPERTEFIQLRASANLKMKNYQQAIVDLRKVLQAEPKNIKAYSEAAQASFELANWDDAVEFFSEVINLDPDDLNAFMLRGRSYMKLKSLEQAIVDFTTAANIDPEHGPAYLYRSSAYKRLGMMDDATEDDEKVKKLMG